jgi:hypothetical protein
VADERGAPSQGQAAMAAGVPCDHGFVRDRVAELRRLLNEWDFIGVFDPETNTDEYDCMITPLLTRARRRRGPE